MTIEEILGFPAEPSQMLQVVNDQIVSCMKAEGFDYTPFSFGEAQVFIGSPMLSDDPVATAQRTGFGVTTRATSGSIELNAPTDPNAEVLASMSDDEIAAWQLALEGDFSSDAPDGCTQRAQRDVFGQFDRLQELAPELDELDTAIASDVRLVAFEADWQACVAARGFNFSSPAEMIDSVMSSLEIEGVELGMTEPPSASDLDEVRSYEISLAVADAECTLELGNVPDTIQREYEEKFVDSNYDRLVNLSEN